MKLELKQEVGNYAHYIFKVICAYLTFDHFPITSSALPLADQGTLDVICIYVLHFRLMLYNFGTCLQYPRSLLH